MKNVKKGVINEGFTVEFSSEDDDAENEPSKKTTKATRAEVPVSVADKENFKGNSSLPYTGSEQDNGQSERKQLPPLGNSTKQSNAKSHRSRSHRSFSATAAVTTSPEKNAQFGIMLPPGMGIGKDVATPPVSVSEINLKNNDSSNHYLNNITIPKDYLRDVRLSLDLTKQFQNNSCSACTNQKSLRTSSSSSDNDHSDDFFNEVGGDDDPPNGDCETCKRKVLNSYRFIVKWIVERPLFAFSVWAFFYIFWGDDALPGGPFFALTVLEITAIVLGHIAELIQMPGLLGMIAAGIILRNVPYIDVAKDLDPNVIGALRGISIVILLVRGGLSVNLPNIVKYKTVIPPLVLGSCALEAAAGALSVYFIVGLPVEWAALMGCIMSAMSSVAVAPYLATTEKCLSLKSDPCSLSPNYQKVLAIARTACGLDAIVAICMAEVCFGFIFAEGSIGGGFMKGVVEILIGGAFGILWGSLSGFLLNEHSSHEKRVTTVFCGGVMSLIGLTKIGYPRGGPLATFLGALITATIWKKKQVGGSNNERLANTFTLIWYFFQPLLFSIIGSRTDFNIVDWNMVTKGLICLAISLSVRFIGSFVMTSWAKLTFKERMYLCIAWLPKGTVQAALGPVALDTALSSSNLASPEEYEDLSMKIMNMSAFTVIAAAIFGCTCLRFIGPRLLSSHK